MTGPIRPSELTPDDAADMGSDDLSDALGVARELEALLTTRGVHPSDGFADRVMVAIAAEPTPQPAMAAGLAVRRVRPRRLLGALADTWRVATTGGRPLAVRAQAAAFVLLALLVFASVGGIAAVGAFELLSPDRTQVPPTQVAVPTINPRPTPSPLNETVEPTPTPSPSAEPGRSSEPADATETQKPASGGSGGDSGGPRPIVTPRPAPTPEPTDDPTGGRGHDHGGGGWWQWGPGRHPRHP